MDSTPQKRCSIAGLVGHRLLHGRGTKLHFWPCVRVGSGWGMLPLLVSCTHVGRYATEGLGWGGACYRRL